VPLRSYGVLTATIQRRRHATTRSDHYVLTCSGGWEVAINAHSDVPPADVEYAVVETEPMLLATGWTPLANGLDYIRGGICTPADFKALPLSEPGADNDLNELFDRHLTVGAIVHAFGERYDTGRGVHDVHQNQGNVARYAEDDGVYQDGGLIIETTAILLRFQSQSWTTDDKTGHAR
jgi:uncharacterized protein YukJ